jgi:peptide methionine sulfoxide reductase MsrB
MPVSEKQLIAIRKNAQKSTGPKTGEVNAIVCRGHAEHVFQSGKKQ